MQMAFATISTTPRAVDVRDVNRLMHERRRWYVVWCRRTHLVPRVTQPCNSIRGKRASTRVRRFLADS